MSDRSNRATVSDIRRAALDALFYTAYQIEAEAELGDGSETEHYQDLISEQATTISVLALLLTPDEVAESLATAQRRAAERVGGA